MTKRRFEIDDEGDYLTDNKTGDLYDACGGGDGFPFVINEYHKLQEENEELKFENENLKVTIQARDALIEVCEKKFRELGFIITVDDDGYVIE